MKILNLTQHVATPDQITAGVFEPFDKKEVQSLLTFDTLPLASDIMSRVKSLVTICYLIRKAVGFDGVMIGGAAYLMGRLETALTVCGFTPVHAFTVRETVEEKQDDGSVKKVAVFRHAGFVT